MFRRILGLVILLATVVVLIVLAATAYFFGSVLETVAAQVDNTLILAVDTMGTVSSTLEQTQSTLVAVNNSIDTAATTTANLSQTVEDTIPLLDQVSIVVTDQIPDNIESIQAAIPNIAAVAGVVDDALVRLSNFGIKQTIPIPFNPIDIDFDLGIDYNPVKPFDETMLTLGTSLDGLPEELRALQSELETSTANLETLSGDLETAAGDVNALNTELAKFIPLLDQYLDLIDRAVGGLEDVRAQLASNLSRIKLVGTILPLVIALTQLAPLVVGWDLLTARSEPKTIAKEVEDQLSLAVSSQAEVEINEPEEVQTEPDTEATLSQELDSSDSEEKF